LGKWERRGKKLGPWPETGFAGDASWKLYAPEGVTVSPVIFRTEI
jgi:hypothetical protein